MELLNDTLVKQFKHNLAETFKEEINVKIKDFKKTFKENGYIILRQGTTSIKRSRISKLSTKTISPMIKYNSFVLNSQSNNSSKASINALKAQKKKANININTPSTKREIVKTIYMS